MTPKIKSLKTAALKLSMGIFVAVTLLAIFAFGNDQNQVQEKKTTDKQPKVVVNDQQKSKQTEERVFGDPLEQPSFQGGDVTKFQKWIYDNLKYPPKAKEKSISGKVYVQFVVSNTGEVVDVKVVRSADPLLDEEAMRVVKSSPKWEPATSKGDKVKQQFTMPITFVNDEQKSTPTDEQVFIEYEEYASFQGGDITKFRGWITKNLIYPTTAKKKGITGKVYVQFTVNSNGEVVDVKVVRGADPLLDEEAIRVVKSSPKWEPAKFKGDKSQQQFTMPITFALK